jgi:hypothetical protein
MFTNPNPNCEKECLFTKSGSMSTLMAYIPMYDKNGNNVNPDRNIISYNISCVVCGKLWSAEECMGETSFRERT